MSRKLDGRAGSGAARTRRLRLLLAITAVLGVALLLRLAPAGRMTLPDGTRLLYGPDSYDHFRRVELILADYPRLPASDSWQGHPVGSPFLLAPLLPLLVATISWLARPFGAGLESAFALAFWLPAGIGTAAFFSAYAFARRGLSRHASILSAAVFVLLPAYLHDSFVGCFDNNLLEPICAALLLAAVVAGQRRDRPTGRAIVTTAALLVGALLAWRGASLLWGLAAISFAACALLDLARSRPPRGLGLGAASFAAAAGAIAALAAAGWLTFAPEVSFRRLSLFHALLAGAAAAGLGAARLVAARLPTGKPLVSVAACALALGTAPAAVLLAVPAVRSELVAAAGMLGRADVWLADNSEYAPILRPDPARPLDLIGPSSELSLVFWLLPAAVALALLGAWRSEERRPWLTAFAVATTGFLAATLLHLRFLDLLALAVAWSVGAAWDHLAPPTATTRRRILLAGILALLLAPAARLSARLPRSPLWPVEAHKESHELLDWLRRATPVPGDRLAASQPADWGVLAPWSFGAWIVNVAGRPAVASNFGAEAHGFAELAEWTLAESDEEALRLLDRERARYVVVESSLPSLPVYARLLARDPALFARSDGASWAPGPKYLGLVSTRLLLADGVGSTAPAPPLAPVAGMRLVWESAGDAGLEGLPWPVAARKIFERVAGARLTGRAEPGAFVTAELALVTNRGRPLRWRSRTMADRDGRYELRVPYASTTIGAATGVRATAPCRLTVNAVAVQVDIPEPAVLTGDEVGVPDVPPTPSHGIAQARSRVPPARGRPGAGGAGVRQEAAS
jgi:asparagine N-glycosylation enzyme membrane subunit Stt3